MTDLDRQLRQQAKTFYIRYTNKTAEFFVTQDLPFELLTNVPALDTPITFRINELCASKLQSAIYCLGDSSWPLQTTGLARDLRCRILRLKQILQSDDVTVKTNYLAQLYTKLCNDSGGEFQRTFVNGFEMVELVALYGEICDALTDEIQQSKVNNRSDLFSHAAFLVPFEQFIALTIGRSPGPTPLEELLTVLAKVINSALEGGERREVSRDRFGFLG